MHLITNYASKFPVETMCGNLRRRAVGGSDNFCLGLRSRVVVMQPLSPFYFAVPMLHSAVPNITLCNYTINVHKGCGPSRDWILTARHVPDNTLQVANFGMMCVDETTCASKAMSADAAAEVCAAAKLCAGQGGARVINAQSGYALADGQDCCSEGEVSLQGSQMGNCTPSPPLYMCIEETGCSYCPHPPSTVVCTCAKRTRTQTTLPTWRRCGR